MELHKSIKPQNTYNISINDDYLTYFDKSYKFVQDNYKEDFDRIAGTKFEKITPEFFFREAVWCILTSGFNARIVSGFFPCLLKTLIPLTDFNSNTLSEEDEGRVATEALSVFGNKRKVSAIIKMAGIIRDNIKTIGWERYRDERLNAADKLEELPFIGKITKFHLARNLGLLDYMKPDLHLTRMAQHWKFESPVELCKEIGKQRDMKIGLVDLVLFYSASTFGSK